MATFYLIFVLLGIFILFIGSLVKIPTAHYGVETLFDKRTERTFKEGLHFKIPFFAEVLIYPMSLETYSFTGSESIIVTSSDKLIINIEGSIQARPAFDKLIKFVEIPEETIQTGMKDAIEGGLGIVAGKEQGESFVENREAISYIINCLFRLERRPDFYVGRINDDDTNDLTIDRDSFNSYISDLRDVVKNKSDRDKIEKLVPTKWKIKEKDGKLDVLDFYNRNVTRIEIMLQLETLDKVKSSSPIEELYALEVKTFKLAKVTYSKAITEAFEKDKQAEKELVASARRQKMKMVIMKALIAKGVPAGQASNDADAAVGIAPKRTISGNAFPFLNIS